MAMCKGYVLAFIAVVVLTFALEGFCESRYQKFLRQHYDNPRSNVKGRYCNTMMQRRRMFRPCKSLNTFVHGTKNDVVKVCGSGGKVYRGNLRVSLAPFQTTTCKLHGVPKSKQCQYREVRSQRYIVISCERNEPVHFDEGLIVTKKP